MKVLSFLIRCNIRKSLIIAVLSVISGLGSAGLIAVVNSTLQPGHSGTHWEAWLAVAFIVTLVAKIAGGVISNQKKWETPATSRASLRTSMYSRARCRIIKLEYGTMVETLHCSAPASVGGTR